MYTVNKSGLKELDKAVLFPRDKVLSVSLVIITLNPFERKYSVVASEVFKV